MQLVTMEVHIASFKGVTSQKGRKPHTNLIIPNILDRLYYCMLSNFNRVDYSLFSCSLNTMVCSPLGVLPLTDFYYCKPVFVLCNQTDGSLWDADV